MTMEMISSFSMLILAISVSMAVLLGVLVAMRILRQQRFVREKLEPLREREFHSTQEEWKVSLERQIADLNRKLTDTVREFQEVNHLLVDAEGAQTPISQRGTTVDSPFLRAMDIPPLEVERNLVFVLTPFEKREQITYAAIVEALQNWGFSVLRGDEERVSANVLRHIVALIAQSRIVIANVSSRNPNVMYELGIAHALGKQVVMIANTIDSVPFDLRNQRILLYSSREDLISKLRESVGKILLSEQAR